MVIPWGVASLRTAGTVHNGQQGLFAMRGPSFATLLIVALATPALGQSGNLDLALEAARKQRRAGDLAAAAGTLRTAIESLRGTEAPDARASLHREFGDLRLQQRRANDAVRQFEAALALDPSSGVLHYQTGLAYRMAGNDRLAADRLEQAVQLGFRTTGALLHLAGANFNAGRFSAGLQRSRELLGLRLQSRDALLQIGQQLFDHFFYADALHAFQAAFDLDPNSFEARVFLALDHFLLNRHQDTIRLLEALDKDSRTAEASSLLGSALARDGREAESEALLRATIERNPASPHAYVNLAFVLLEQDRRDEAGELLETANSTEINESPKVFYSVQRNSCQTVVDEAALESVASPSKIPWQAQAYYGLARDLASRHHHGTAVEVLRLVREHEGNSPRTLEALAYSCLSIDPNSSAPIRLLGELLALEPDRAPAHHLLGRALLRQGEVDEALNALRRAVDLSPDHAEILTDLGRALASAKGAEYQSAAIETLARAAQLDSRNVIARYELGKLLSVAGRYDEALQALREAIETEPEFDSAYYAIGQVHLRAGQPDQARAYLEQFQEKRATAEARASVGEGFASAH